MATTGPIDPFAPRWYPPARFQATGKPSRRASVKAIASRVAGLPRF